jgi:hypothetical protein
MFIIIIFTTYSKPIASEEAKVPISRSQSTRVIHAARLLEIF